MPAEAGGGQQPSRGYSELNPDFLEGQPVLFYAVAPVHLCSVLDVSLWKFGLLYLSEDASSLFLTCSERTGV